MLQKIWKVIKSFLFVGILGLTICNVTAATLPKIPDFYAQKEWDVVFFGTSQSYCTFDPAVFDHYGLKSYNRGRQQQTMNYTYYYVKDALDNSDIDVVVLEVFGLFYDEGDERFEDVHIRESSLGDFRHSPIKVEMIKEVVPEEEQFSYLFPLDKYHTNWELWDFTSREGFFKSVLSPYYKESSDRGFMRWKGSEWFWYPNVDEMNQYKSKPENVYEENIRYLNMIRQLCREHDAELLLVKGPLPCFDTVVAKMVTVEAWAKTNGVKLINYMDMYQELDLNEYTDSLDGGAHLSEAGAGKVSNHLANYITEAYFKEAE